MSEIARDFVNASRQHYTKVTPTKFTNPRQFFATLLLHKNVGWQYISESINVQGHQRVKKDICVGGILGLRTSGV